MDPIIVHEYGLAGWCLRDQSARVLAVGLVIALPLFVLHHAALQIESAFIEGIDEMPHAVGFHE